MQPIPKHVNPDKEREREREFCKKHGVVKIINAGVSQTLNIPQNHSKIS